MDEKVKVGVIGLGGIAQLVHLPNLIKLDGALLTSVAEINKSRLNALADKFNVKEKYSDYKELLEKSDVDAVIVSTPTASHKDIAIDCLKANKDVLVEKPLARTYAEAKQIIDAAKKSKRKLMVGMNLRYRPDAMLLRSLIGSGEIGNPLYIKCGWIRRQSSGQKWFTQKEHSGGGVIIDLGILLLDLSLWLFDYPVVTSVSTQNFMLNTKSVEDTSVAMFKCKNSAVITMESSWSLPIDRDLFYLNVYGSKGFATLSPFRIYRKVEDQVLDLSPSQKESSLSLFKKSYLNELKSFIGAVKGLNPVFSSGDEALSRMKILEAMYKSSQTNKEIKLQQI